MATMTIKDLQERVDRGIAWLDEHDPGWWKADQPGHGEDGRPIDLDELNMAHNCYCVLGQRFGNYYRVEIGLDEAVAYGFDTAVGSRDLPLSAIDRSGPDAPTLDEVQAAMADEFDALRELWIRVVEQRRAEAGQ